MWVFFVWHVYIYIPQIAGTTRKNLRPPSKSGYINQDRIYVSGLNKAEGGCTIPDVRLPGVGSRGRRCREQTPTNPQNCWGENGDHQSHMIPISWQFAWLHRSSRNIVMLFRGSPENQRRWGIPAQSQRRRRSKKNKKKVSAWSSCHCTLSKFVHVQLWVQILNVVFELSWICAACSTVKKRKNPKENVIFR